MLKTRLHLIPVFCLLSVAAYSQSAKPDVHVSVPDLGKQAISIVKAPFPATAVDVGADGSTLLLMLVIDENGNVVSAKCAASCHPMLKDAAELAAMTSKFKPLEVDGRPVKYEGILHYTFVVNQIDWFRFGSALESTRQFDNISLTPVAEILSNAFSEERTRLLSLDANGGVDYNTRQKGIADVERSIKSKLKGADLWKFEMSMALRRVTFWTGAQKVDRGEMQKAIDQLPSFIAAAPEGTSKELLDCLREFAKFRATPEMSDREIDRLFFDMSRRMAPYQR